MQILPSFLDLLRSRLSLAELVGRQVKLTRKGRLFKGLCPFHQEKTPSFTVDEERDSYHCFGCGAHGDGIKFLMETQKHSFIEAVRELAGQVGLDLPEKSFAQDQRAAEDLSPLKEALKEAAAWFQRNLSQAQGGLGLRYAEKRALTRETLKLFGMGYAPEGRHHLETYLLSKGFSKEILVKSGLVFQTDETGKIHDRFRQRLMFPIQDPKGHIVGFGGRLLGAGEPKYLNSPETALFSKGKLLYGYTLAKEKPRADPLLIVEGYMDVIALHQAGYKGAVAPLGTALTEDQILLAWRLAPEPILCFDGDGAGLNAALRAAERVLPLLKPGQSLQFMFLPQGEDPDSLLKKGPFFETLLQKTYSLSEALWLFATTGKSLKTPEQKAGLQKQCDQWVNLIVNADIKKNYYHAFRNFFYRDCVGKHVKAPSLSVLKKEPLNFISIREHLLLAILINHPKLLCEVSDELAAADFQDSSLWDVKEAMLAFYGDHGEDQTSLREYLISQGFEGEIKRVLAPQTVIHGAFAHPHASQEEAHEGWKEIFGRTQAMLGRKDLSLAQAHLAQEMTEKAWQRLKMLKKDILLED